MPSDAAVRVARIKAIIGLLVASGERMTVSEIQTGLDHMGLQVSRSALHALLDRMVSDTAVLDRERGYGRRGGRHNRVGPPRDFYWVRRP